MIHNLSVPAEAKLLSPSLCSIMFQPKFIKKTEENEELKFRISREIWRKLKADLSSDNNAILSEADWGIINHSTLSRSVNLCKQISYYIIFVLIFSIIISIRKYIKSFKIRTLKNNLITDLFLLLHISTLLVNPNLHTSTNLEMFCLVTSKILHNMAVLWCLFHYL